MIYDDYIHHTQEFQSKYGIDTVVFMQVGDFFELYAVHNDEEKAGADIFRVAEICNLQVTKKNKSLAETSRSNPYMAGFPLAIVQKHVQALTQNGFTVVIIRQVTPPPNVKREVTEIISPSTNTQPTSAEGVYLMTCYVEETGGFSCVGISAVDVTTGHCFVREAYSSKQDPTYALDETYRILCAYAPKEIVLVGDPSIKMRATMISMSGGQAQSVHDRFGTSINMYKKPSYQNEVLQKAFPPSKTCAGMLTCIEACHLEKMDVARVAFTYMIQFAYEHNEKLVDNIQIPQVLESSKLLTLEYNSALQLNLVGCLQGEKPLISILNRCGTAFGTRLFKERLMSPITCKEELEKRYAQIEGLATSELAYNVHKRLCNIQDLERLARRMRLGTFSPIDWYTLHSSLENALQICTLLGESKSEWQELISSYKDLLDLEACSKYVLTDIRGNVFKTGVHHDLDSIADEYKKDLNFIQGIADHITSYDKDACLCRVECNERDGFYLSITKKRWETAKRYAGKKLDAFDAKPISSSSAMLRVWSAETVQASDRLLDNQRKLGVHATLYFKEFVLLWISTYNEKLQQCIDWLANIDVACTNARNAMDYGYVRPNIVDEGKSFIQCTNLRHPIIERLITNVDYVGNDVALGASSSYDSMLLFGINSSGKSSFMKAIGLNVIMAQAGMYVACSSMYIHPYKHIFTRISGADNIYRGMSSFTVEMTELNNILHRCDAYSLVLGDELCAGTEAISGLAIVSAGIHHLSQKQAHFVFATHLHDLIDIPIVQEITRMRVAHMHIDIDPDNRVITYHRKLRDGLGSRVYGLEVCGALGLPSNFMKVANDVRRHIQQVPTMLVRQTMSRYNKSVVMDCCKICGAAASETHHIRYQCTASDKSVGKGVHVHRASNLVPLCEKCHQKEHCGEINIEGYSQTSEGIQLQVIELPKDTTILPTTEDQLRSILRFGTCGWKAKTANGSWKKISESTARRKLKILLHTEEVDMEYQKGELFDPSF